MKNIVYIVIFTVLLTSTLGLTSQAYAEEIVLSAETKFLEYRYNQTPSISGIVTDLDGNPLSRVQVFASFPYVKDEISSDIDNTGPYATTLIGITTFSDGKFLLSPKNPSPAGEHTIKVTAKQDKMEETVLVTYNVKENPRIAKSVTESMIVTESNNLSMNLLERQMETQKMEIEENSKISKSVKQSMILNESDNLSMNLLEKQMETQKMEIEEIPNIINKENESQQLIEKQRQDAKQDLENDLISFEKKHEINSPRNAFADFIAKIDLSLRALFWDQFEFTQNKHDQGYQAKIKALEQGKTSQQAMKIFQEEAASTHDEIVEYNEMLNVKYGFANQTVQDKFDKKGKLPRTGE